MVGVGGGVVHEPGILFYLVFLFAGGDGGRRGVASEDL